MATWFLYLHQICAMYFTVGKQVDGSRIAAGHAVLASHESQGEMKSKDGFFVKEIRGRLQNPYIFPKDQEIPPYISKKLDWIEKKWNDWNSCSYSSIQLL